VKTDSVRSANELLRGALRRLRKGAAILDEELRGPADIVPDDKEIERAFAYLADARGLLKLALRDEVKPALKRERARREKREGNAAGSVQ
jgi:hypothetical protein